MQTKEISYRGYRLRREIISHGVWLYHRLALSFRDIEELSHQPTRQMERQMRGFKSPGQTQRFLSVHRVIQNRFRLGRHLLRPEHYRVLRARSFAAWSAATAK